MVRVVDKKPVARPEPDDEPDEPKPTIGFVRKPPLGWIWGGLLVGLVQLIAIWVHGPVEILPDALSVEAGVLEQASPPYAAAHPLLKDPEARKFSCGGWFMLGTIAGGAGAAMLCGRWRVRHNSAWWSENHGHARRSRYGIVFLGGVLVMFGAHLARGGAEGHFFSGWSQLSALAFPFTVAMIAFAFVTARLFHSSTPPIER